MNYLRKSLIFSTPVARRLQELKFLLVILVASGSAALPSVARYPIVIIAVIMFKLVGF